MACAEPAEGLSLMASLAGRDLGIFDPKAQFRYSSERRPKRRASAYRSSLTGRMAAKETAMAHETSGTGATAAGGGTLVIPGEMAARVDRLPMSAMAWEICLIIQIGWAVSASTDGIAARLYPFVWLP